MNYLLRESVKNHEFWKSVDFIAFLNDDNTYSISTGEYSGKMVFKKVSKEEYLENLAGARCPLVIPLGAVKKARDLHRSQVEISKKMF